MKKIIPLFCFVATMQTAFAQNSNFRRDSLYQIFKKAQTPAEQVRAWGNIGGYYRESGQPDSLQYANGQMLKIASGKYQDSLFAKAYLQIGSYFSNISDFKQALEYQFKSLSFAESAKNIQDIWLATKEVGVSFKQLKNYSEALRYLKKAVPLINMASVNVSDVSNRTYTHLAEVFLGLAQPDSALR